MTKLQMKLVAIVVLICLSPTASAFAIQEPQLSEEQMQNFLLTAKVIKSSSTKKGITGVRKLTLSDGQITHDASFQSIDEYSATKRFDSGRMEVNFRDSYKYNIAAYELAKLLGLRDMIPMTVERKWGDKVGSLCWWVPSKLDEEVRQKKKITAPDPEGWAKQYNKMVVFGQLVFDVDRNQGNILYTEEWHLWMIDFSRSFRNHIDLENPKALTRCDRELFAALKQLDSAKLAEATKRYLTTLEIKGVMARRDKIVALFEKLIAEKGEGRVLY